MIIYQNALTKFDYEPATDILMMEWPDMQYYNLKEVKDTLQMLVDQIIDYDIKKLLIDSSKTDFNIQEPAYLEVVKESAYRLLSTRLEKIARIQTSDFAREGKVEEAKSMAGPSLEVKTFPDIPSAMQWLQKAS